eukprot:1147420-Pelagomonas_calceolata.AAC.2
MACFVLTLLFELFLAQQSGRKASLELEKGAQHLALALGLESTQAPCLLCSDPEPNAARSPSCPKFPSFKIAWRRRAAAPEIKVSSFMTEVGNVSNFSLPFFVVCNIAALDEFKKMFKGSVLKLGRVPMAEHIQTGLNNFVLKNALCKK